MNWFVFSVAMLFPAAALCAYGIGALMGKAIRLVWDQCGEVWGSLLFATVVMLPVAMLIGLISGGATS